MSHRYLTCLKSAFAGTTVSPQDLLRVLGNASPGMIARLTVIDWPALQRQFATEALEAVVTALSMEFRRDFETGAGFQGIRRENAAGECLGVVYADACNQVGLFQASDGALSLIETESQYDGVSERTDEEQKVTDRIRSGLEKEYRERCVRFALEFVAGKVRTVETEEATIFLADAAKKGVRS